jgi:hypothetical protein
MKMDEKAITFSFPQVRALLLCVILVKSQVRGEICPNSNLYSQVRALPMPSRNAVAQAVMAKAAAAAAAVLAAITSMAHPFTSATVAPTKGNSAGSFGRPR